jgi:hypothetical protein
MVIDFETLSMMDLRSSPGEILDRVAEKGEAFIIERNGQQKACLVPISLFFPAIQKDRLTQEIDSLASAGEEPRAVTVNDAREIEFRFRENSKDGEVTVRIVLPHGYPHAAPRVYASPIKDGTPHRWGGDGMLCIWGASEVWNPGRHNLASVIKLGRQWLEGYSLWLETGCWAGQQGGVEDDRR